MTLPPIRTAKFKFWEISKLLGRPDPLVLEIGANNGKDSLEFLRAFPGCRLHAFEPDPRAIRNWRRRVDDPRATLWPIAVGAADGTATFHMSDGQEEKQPEGWDASGSLRAPTPLLQETWPWLRFERTVEVQCRRLDSWAAENGIGHVDFIWADVQGAEIDLIEGGRQTLARTDWLFTEYNDREYYAGLIGLDQILQALPDFEVAERWPADVLLRRVR
jgi:FkbM family methyltransferase